MDVWPQRPFIRDYERGVGLEILFPAGFALRYNGETILPGSMLGTYQKPVYIFGEYRVDVLRRRLFLNDEPLTVTAKAFDVLVKLIERSGEIVSKDELMNAVWVDAAVEENNLTQQVSALRRLFNERAGDHCYIVTVPGRGYCFVSPVYELQAEVGSEMVPAVSMTSSITIDISNSDRARPVSSFSFDPATLRGTAIAAAYIIVVCMSAFIFGGWNSGPNFRPRSVGVLMFRTLGADDDRYGIGIRDTLRAKLGSLDDITVRPEKYALPEADPLGEGRRMGVDVVLAGSIQREESRIRVAVEIVDVRSERILWGKTFDDEAENLFELQDSIAAEVVETLRSTRRPRASSLPAGPFSSSTVLRAALLDEQWSRKYRTQTWDFARFPAYI